MIILQTRRAAVILYSFASAYMSSSFSRILRQESSYFRLNFLQNYAVLCDIITYWVGWFSYIEINRIHV